MRSRSPSAGARRRRRPAGQRNHVNSGIPYPSERENGRRKRGAGLTASGADLVKPGGSGTAGEAEEEEASWSSTAQRRARPLPFSIATARGIDGLPCCRRGLRFRRWCEAGIGTRGAGDCSSQVATAQLVGRWFFRIGPYVIAYSRIGPVACSGSAWAVLWYFVVLGLFGSRPTV
jgi:hypothetical protein